MAIPYKVARLFAREILKPEKTRASILDQQDSRTAATAQWFEFDLPKDRLIWAILISIGEDATATGTQGTLADDLEQIQVIANGNKYLKDMDAVMSKQIGIVNHDVLSTGYYKIYFKDPKIDESKPLPAWVFTSLKLRVRDNAPATGNYHHVRVSLIESERIGDISGWRTLIEKYLGRESYGTGTGWKEYEHERAYRIYGYLYAMDDNDTLSNTIFDKLKVIGKRPDREDRLFEEMYIAHIRELNRQEYQNALDTGFMMVEFPQGFETDQYTSLKSYVNIPTAGTDAGLKVLERYLL